MKERVALYKQRLSACPGKLLTSDSLCPLPSAVDGGGDPVLRSPVPSALCCRRGRPRSAIPVRSHVTRAPGSPPPATTDRRTERVAFRPPLSAVDGGGDPVLRFLSDPTSLEHRGHRRRLQQTAVRQPLPAAFRIPLSAVDGGGDPVLRFLSDPRHSNTGVTAPGYNRPPNRARRLPASAFRFPL